MKVLLSLASLAATLLIAGLVQAAGPAPQAASAAAIPGAVAPLGLAELHQRLVAAGYRDISELNRQRDQVEAEARDRDGRRVELAVDPHTAGVRRIELKREREHEREHDGATTSGLDLAQLIARVEAAGYRAVSRIEREHDEVEVRAEDAQGRRVTLRLDPLTGALRDGRR